MDELPKAGDSDVAVPAGRRSTGGPPPGARRAARIIAVVIRQLLRRRTPPILVALDGGSGAGKSTVAHLLALEMDASVFQSDDFFAASVPSAAWDARTPQQKAADAVDWRLLRTEAIEPLLAGRTAKWHAFDFPAARPDGTFPMRTDFVVLEPSDVILVDGQFSCRPELADLIDLSVLIDAPVNVRRARLNEREDPDWLAEWHARWDCAEEFYAVYVRPRSTFDLVVTTEPGTLEEGREQASGADEATPVLQKASGS